MQGKKLHLVVKTGFVLLRNNKSKQVRETKKKEGLLYPSDKIELANR